VPLIFCPYYTSAEVVTTVGVDTHKDVLTSPSPWWTVSAETPRHSEFVPTSPVGYKESSWTLGERVRSSGFGPLERAGVEGTGSFGCGLARLFLQAPRG
jgi:hypothetical protein